MRCLPSSPQTRLASELVDDQCIVQGAIKTVQVLQKMFKLEGQFDFDGQGHWHQFSNSSETYR